jgi:hypothetical protein
MLPERFRLLACGTPEPRKNFTVRNPNIFQPIGVDSARPSPRLLFGESGNELIVAGPTELRSRRRTLRTHLKIARRKKSLRLHLCSEPFEQKLYLPIVKTPMSRPVAKSVSLLSELRNAMIQN